MMCILFVQLILVKCQAFNTLILMNSCKDDIRGDSSCIDDYCRNGNCYCSNSNFGGGNSEDGSQGDGGGDYNCIKNDCCYENGGRCNYTDDN